MKCAKYMKIWFEMNEVLDLRCVKNARIRSYSGPHFPAFGLNTDRYGVGYENSKILFCFEPYIVLAKGKSILTLKILENFK